MDIQKIMKIVDASYDVRRVLDRTLREIDRRALNAMVLVKRHGNALAGYGVVAQAFRERATNLKEAASHLQEAISPLIRIHMRVLQHRSHIDLFERVRQKMDLSEANCPRLLISQQSWEQRITAEEAGAQETLKRLIQAIKQLQDGIAEQEYVVTNARIEAALSENSGAPLMHVSRDMGIAVAEVRKAIWVYREQLEELLHESGAGL